MQLESKLGWLETCESQVERHVFGRSSIAPTARLSTFLPSHSPRLHAFTRTHTETSNAATSTDSTAKVSIACYACRSLPCAQAYRSSWRTRTLSLPSSQEPPNGLLDPSSLLASSSSSLGQSSATARQARRTTLLAHHRQASRSCGQGNGRARP